MEPSPRIGSDTRHKQKQERKMFSKDKWPAGWKKSCTELSVKLGGDLSTHYSGVFIETVTAFLSSLSFPSSLPSRAEEGVPRPCFAYPGTRRLTCTSGSLLAQERRAGVPHGALALPASSGRGGCEEIHGGGVPVGVHAQTRVCSCRSQTQWGDACPRLGLFWFPRLSC